MQSYVWTPELAFVVGYLLLINGLAFGAFALDKYFAKKHMRRISERTSLTLAMFGGLIGAITGQHLLRHKTRKQPFKTMLNVMPILHIVVAALWWFLLVQEIP